MQNRILKKSKVNISSTPALNQAQIEVALSGIVNDYDPGTDFFYSGGGTQEDPDWCYRSHGTQGASLEWTNFKKPKTTGTTSTVTVAGPSVAGGTLSALAIGDFALISKGSLIWEYADSSTEQKSRYVPAEYLGGGFWKLLEYGVLHWTSAKNPWGIAGNDVGLDTSFNNNLLYLKDDGTLGLTPGTVHRQSVLVIDGSTIYVSDWYSRNNTGLTLEGIDNFIVSGTTSLDMSGSETYMHEISLTNNASVTAVNAPKGHHFFYISNPSTFNLNFTAANSSQPELAPQPYSAAKIVIGAWFDDTDWIISSVGSY